MTADRDFKRLVRARAARTGESYQAARRLLLARSEEEHVTYAATAIAQPTTLADIRANPPHFVVDVGNDGVNHLCLELIANAVDEAVAGFASEIVVTVHADGFTVQDDGRGIPVEVPEGSNRSAAELVVTVPGASAKRHGDSYRLPGGSNGLGLTVVAALSSRLNLEVDRGDERHRAVFASGAVVESLHVIGPSSRASGTSISVQPDAAVFGDARIAVRGLASRLREVVALHPGLRVRLVDEVGGTETDLAATDGVASLVPDVDRAEARLGAAQSPFGEAHVVVARASVAPVVRAFVNDLEMDGDHLAGARSALPEGLWHLVVSARVSSPAYEVVEGSHIAHGRGLADLASRAAASAMA